MGAAVGDGVVAPARVIGSVGSDRADLYISGDLVEKLGQHGRVTDVAAGDFDGSDLQRLFIDADVDLAPQTAFRTAMLAGLPLTFALRLDAGAVDQKVQRPLRAPVGNTHSQGFPAPARAVLKSGTARPVEADQPQKALDDPRGLPAGHAEEDFHRQACLDRGIAILWLPASLAGGRWHPDHVRIEPDRQGAALLQRFVVGRPVPGLVARRDGSAHAGQLPRWIHEMNPSPSLCATKPASIVRDRGRAWRSSAMDPTTGTGPARAVAGFGPAGVVREHRFQRPDRAQCRRPRFAGRLGP